MTSDCSRGAERAEKGVPVPVGVGPVPRAGAGGARPLPPESSGCERARGPWPCARAVGTAGEVTSALELDQGSSTQSNPPPLRRKEQNTVTGPQGPPH